MQLHLYAQPLSSLQPEWDASSASSSRELEAFQNHLHSFLEKDIGLGLVVLGLADPALSFSTSLAFWNGFAKEFCTALRLTADLEAMRDRVVVAMPEGLESRMLARVPPMPGAEFVQAELLLALWGKMQSAVQGELASSRKSVAQVLAAWGAQWHLAGRVHFHLVENRENIEAPFAFLATYSAEPNEQGKIAHVPLHHALQAYGRDGKRMIDLLSTVQTCASRVPLIKRLLDSGKLFQPLAWKVAEAYQFLNALPVFEECGVLCRVPKWWSVRSGPRLQLQVGKKAPTQFGLNAIFAANPQLWLEGEVVTEQEIRKLLAAKEGLALLKGRWVEVNRATLQATLDRFAQIRKMLVKGVTLRDAMRLAAGVREGTELQGVDGFEVCFGDFLQNLTEKLRNPALIRGIKPAPASFHAKLRPYQQIGLDWMRMLHSLGLGACLADDMGLGKTIQVLAFLDQIRGKSGRPCLLVVPASLLPNWNAEAQKFAPSLRLLFAHAAFGQNADRPAPAVLAQVDLVVTSYGMLPRLEWLPDVEWECVIADEAQALKNAATRQAKSIRKIPAQWRIAMTGTPVENRLLDLWAIFDFINPGLLGSHKEFEHATARMQKDHGSYGALRQVLKPYILRRMKTDKSIIADLPDKVETNVFAGLAKAQVVLYTKSLKDLEEQLHVADGMKRRGLVLSMLIKLKQICNHPDLYHGANVFAEGDSGKFAALREICTTIAEKREKVLVFTQFQEMCAPLALFLQNIFGRDGCVLHGGTGIAARRMAVQRFQEEPQGYVPWFVLSLKAGGTGLNLTGANHVVHFDRWWNPAVEDQATDRAFRIGQTRNVLVHKFVCRGTLEERIDKALADKRILAGEIVGDGNAEQWITEMDDKSILDLFRLDLKSAVGE